MHKKIKKLIEAAYSQNLPEHKIEKMAERIANSVHNLDDDEQILLAMDLDLIIYGPHFNREQAEYAVSKLENEDGTTGGHWTYEEVKSVLASHDLDMSREHFTECDFYYVINMLYSDMYELLGSSTDNYYKASLLWLRDKDAPVGKAKRYYYAMK